MFFPPSSTINSKEDALRIQKGLASVFDVVPLFCARMRLLVLFVCSDGGSGSEGEGGWYECECVFLGFFLHFFHLVAFRGIRGRQCQIKTAETLLVSLLLSLFISFFVRFVEGLAGPRLQIGERDRSCWGFDRNRKAWWEGEEGGETASGRTHLS